MERFSIEWQAPEFEYREKDVSWYWLSAMIAAILLSASIWQKNFLFTIFIIVAEILVLVWAGRKPRTLLFKIDEKGLTINRNKFYPYSQMEAFSIREGASNEWAEAVFKFRKGARHLIKALIPAKRAAEIEKALAPVLDKKDFEEGLIDSMERFLGF
ncbi:MAG: hypothetical protein HY432_02665 [Candidatus Liptonbacteria bacterium]|nr:hypothetical protein [Candidatus Liptonbacteria bacterium]